MCGRVYSEEGVHGSRLTLGTRIGQVAQIHLNSILPWGGLDWGSVPLPSRDCGLGLSQLSHIFVLRFCGESGSLAAELGYNGEGG